ncbi:MAG: hypothetical protein AAF985_03230 [Bacteroidota bacterium]
MKNHFSLLTLAIVFLSVLSSCEKNDVSPVFGTTEPSDEPYFRCEGTLYGIDHPFTGNFGDLYLEFAYDANLASFSGFVRNEGAVKMCNIKVAIEMKEGTIFLSSTESERGTNLFPDGSFNFELSDQRFNPTSYRPNISTDGPCS